MRSRSMVSVDCSACSITFAVYTSQIYILEVFTPAFQRGRCSLLIVIFLVSLSWIGYQIGMSYMYNRHLIIKLASKHSMHCSHEQWSKCLQARLTKRHHYIMKHATNILVVWKQKWYSHGRWCFNNPLCRILNLCCIKLECKHYAVLVKYNCKCLRCMATKPECMNQGFFMSPPTTYRGNLLQCQEGNLTVVFLMLTNSRDLHRLQWIDFLVQEYGVDEQI
jgi:hypothetical protein